MLDSDLYTCSANGRIQVRDKLFIHLFYFLTSDATQKRWSSTFDLSASWSAHSSIILSSIVDRPEPSKSVNGTLSKARAVLITGGNDDYIKACFLGIHYMRTY